MEDRLQLQAAENLLKSGHTEAVEGQRRDSGQRVTSATPARTASFSSFFTFCYAQIFP